MEKKEHLLRDKILYTCLIVLVYLVGKCIPLFMVDVSAYAEHSVTSEALLVQTISGDINQCSLFALGISPYMISSILIMILFAFKSKEAKKSISPIRKNKMTLSLALLLAIIMAVVQVDKLQFRDTGDMLFVAKMIAAAEMVTGAFVIIHLSSRLRKYGVGGQSPIILLNIIDGIIITMSGHEYKQLAVPCLISLAVMVVVLFMENAEKRIPVQRISIHNIYADKNYMAIKLNPIGVMPAMFATAFFMLPQLILSLIGWFLPESETVIWLQDNMNLSSPLGIGVYAVILFLLTIGFSRVMINPKEITENFLKSGDSIRDLHAGRDTKRYLSGVITRLSLLSASVMCICLCTPLLLQLYGSMESTFVSLPSSVMMMTGMWSNFTREVASVRDLESYKPFI